MGETTSTWITGIARAIIVVLSTIVTSLTVLGLYFIDSVPARLGAVVGFSAVFSFTVTVFSPGARSVEIFAATAA